MRIEKAVERVERGVVEWVVYAFEHARIGGDGRRDFFENFAVLTRTAPIRVQFRIFAERSVGGFVARGVVDGYAVF